MADLAVDEAAPLAPAESPPNDDVEEQCCKICRLPSEADNPLYYPCKCSVRQSRNHSKLFADFLQLPCPLFRCLLTPIVVLCRDLSVMYMNHVFWSGLNTPRQTNARYEVAFPFQFFLLPFSGPLRLIQALLCRATYFHDRLLPISYTTLMLFSLPVVQTCVQIHRRCASEYSPQTMLSSKETGF